MEEVQQAAKFYTYDDWDLIRVKLEANRDILANIEGGDYVKKMREYMMNYVKSQGNNWKIIQLKNLSHDQLKEEFEKCVRHVQRFIPMDSELEVATLKRPGSTLQPEEPKKQKIIDVEECCKNEPRRQQVETSLLPLQKKCGQDGARQRFSLLSFTTISCELPVVGNYSVLIVTAASINTANDRIIVSGGWRPKTRSVADILLSERMYMIPEISGMPLCASANSLFYVEPKKHSSCSVQLINKTDNHVASKKYSVRPNTGVIDPNSASEFSGTGAPDHWRLVRAHGTAVGLPTEDDMGNSEVEHNAFGAGSIFAQW
ncbi:putative 2,3-bisphosphoglycerate-independent phosphoglycerate mutase 2 [Artemisia annua]|uniref:Putative 2,3-bisphosphoglycerate-independent phosphoglycerate mutase 2 n=1 Tax=Artemisia annua TaxID=35608 RepID=A0A2U1QDB3_ARTAN|nr:putative 2,3-bisphosphoglycerate-independent phosphoglycerate mutase 2 [Artemisia annua]